MTSLSCPTCEADQEVTITPDTYNVECAHCGSEFLVPREHRVNKRETQEYSSRVNIRIGFRVREETMTVGWTVQSAEKGNQYMEQRTVAADISDHPEKTYWYVAIFKALQHVGEYKSARIWVKHDNVIKHLSGEYNVPADDLRSQLALSITDLCSERFLGCEFAATDRTGQDIKQMLANS